MASLHGNHRRQVEILAAFESRYLDFDMMAESAIAWDQKYDHIGRGPFQGRLSQVVLNTLQVGRAGWKPGIMQRGSAPMGSWVIAFQSHDHDIRAGRLGRSSPQPRNLALGRQAYRQGGGLRLQPRDSGHCRIRAWSSPFRDRRRRHGILPMLAPALSWNAPTAAGFSPRRWPCRNPSGRHIFP